ncbi:translation initiation factor eIF-4F [Exophiala viscosa]|uniref:Translation initiation factor eIF-4F n=1 Tax=Exophiala viscosa TaxID=2486360 RepID=A0AAN6DYF7_9EURO|nr:translation initiation factor eIF-4F [Exophiala viscosa]KAI1624153.1 translation initiation factor eIF-4F [Exophiala viscosa]
MTSSPPQSTTSRSKPAASATGAQSSNLANGSNLAAQGRNSLPSATSPSSFKPNASEPNKMSAAVGGAPPTHNHSESMNGRNPTIPAIPSVNGNVSLPDSTSKPSMTVTPAGATTNGGASSGPQNKPGIQFGSIGMANANSPAMGTPSLALQNSSNLSVAGLNPGATSPSNSPSPIPQPAVVSGGRPPSSFQGQGNGYTFGQMPTPADPSDPSGLSRPMSQLQFGAQQDHMRRGSSQSVHSDVGGPGLPTGPGRGGYQGQGGRGRGFNPSYQQPMQYSPHQSFRPPSNGRVMQGGYQGRGQQLPHYQGSPAMGTRSPALVNATPGTPNMNPLHMVGGMQGMPGQPNGYYMGPQHGFGLPTQADPSIQMLYQQQYYGPGGMQGQYPPQYMQPQSPRPPFQQNAYAPNMQPAYSNQGAPPSMSRQSSQMSAPERPGSSIGQQPHTPGPSGPPQAARTPSVSAQKPSYTIPPKKSAAIIIKNTAGEVVSFAKPPASPATATPVTVIAAPPPQPVPTPPSRTASAADNAHNRTDSAAAKTAEEARKSMQEAIAKKIAEDEAKSRAEKELAEKAQMDKEAAEAAEREAAEAKARADALEKEAAEAAARKAEEDAEAAKAVEEEKPEEQPEEQPKEQPEEQPKEQLEEQPEEKPEEQPEEKPEEKSSEPAKAEEEEIDYDAIEAELAAQEAEEARLEEEYNKKKAAKLEAQRKKEQEEAAAYEANMKELERKAEEAELAREKEKADGASGDETSKKLFAELKANPLGTPASTESPPAQTPAESGTATPVSDVSMPPPAAKAPAKRGKAAELTLDTKKPIEPPEPSATLKSLQASQKLDDLSKVSYPTDITAPDSSLNADAPADRKFKYDKEFLLQFQDVFKEKPTLDWDLRIRDALGDGDSSARAGASARTPSGMGNRSASSRGPPAMSNFGGPMGSFGGARGNLPPGTTSEQRFAASNAAARGVPSSNPFAQFGRPGQMAPAMGRTPSNNPLGPIPGSPRMAGGASRGGSRAESKRSKQNTGHGHGDNKSMPLTAGMNIGSLEVSSTGWKPRSIGQNIVPGPALGGDGLMEPDVVQRKVKAALNKMTPEKFDKIADQVLEIAAQSKHESDGRTLRQVIQLTFEKATDEAHWAPMYAAFARKMLESMSPDIRDEGIKDKNGNVVTGGNLFRKYLLNRCQEEFERGWKVNLPPQPEGKGEEVMLSDEYYIAAAAKRRGLGLVRFIGELFKLSMLTERIMHECVKKLVDYEGTPDEAEIESLTGLLRTVGRQLDSPESKGAGRMDVYFERINAVIVLPDLPSRLRFMLMDIVDLRRKGWVSKADDKGPKTIAEIHEEAERKKQEDDLKRLATQGGGRGGGRLPMGRGDARSFSNFGGQVPPPDNSNRVGTDDLRRLGNRNARNPSHTGTGSLGPPSMLSGRTNSGRRGLGPGGLLSRGEDSNTSSRTGTPPAGKDKKDEASTNAFSALAALENEGPGSPPSNPASPPTQKSQPNIEPEQSSSAEKNAE